MSKDQNANELEKSSHSLEECFDEDQMLDHDEVMKAIRRGTLTTIPKDNWFDEGDFIYLNKLRKRRKYLKVEISEEQYSRLLKCSRQEKIPMRYLGSRAVEIYLNQFGKYGWSEIPILRNITPFNND